MAEQYQDVWSVNEVSNLKNDGVWPDYVPPNPILQYGWIGGGGSTQINTVQRITYAADTNNAIDRCDLITPRYLFSAVTNGTNGWFAGGEAPGGAANIVDRITLSDDTTNALDRCDLSSSRNSLTGISNGTYGYFTGGANFTTIDRVDYANDTTNAIAKGSTPLPGYDVAGVANGTYGYWAGGAGYTPGFTALTAINRSDFANDTAAAIFRCNRTTGGYGNRGVSDGTYAWFAGGYGPSSNNNIIDRMTFSADTTNAIDRCDLTAVKLQMGNCADGTYGWFIAGSPNNNVVERITLASDTVNAIDRCDILSAASSSSAPGSLNNTTNAGY